MDSYNVKYPLLLSPSDKPPTSFNPHDQKYDRKRPHESPSRRRSASPSQQKPSSRRRISSLAYQSTHRFSKNWPRTRFERTRRSSNQDRPLYYGRLKGKDAEDEGTTDDDLHTPIQVSATSPTKSSSSQNKDSCHLQSSTVFQPDTSHPNKSLEEGEVSRLDLSRRRSSSPRSQRDHPSDHRRPADYWRPRGWRSTPASRGVQDTDKWRPGDSYTQRPEDVTIERRNARDVLEKPMPPSIQTDISRTQITEASILKTPLLHNERASNVTMITQHKSLGATLTQFQDIPPSNLDPLPGLFKDEDNIATRESSRTITTTLQAKSRANSDHRERTQVLKELRLDPRNNSRLFRPLQEVLKQKPHIRSSAFEPLSRFLPTPNVSASKENKPFATNISEPVVQPLSWKARAMTDGEVDEKNTFIEGDAPRMSWAAQALAVGNEVSQPEIESEVTFVKSDPSNAHIKVESLHVTMHDVEFGRLTAQGPLE